MARTNYLVGLDVGSTTVKAVVVDARPTRSLVRLPAARNQAAGKNARVPRTACEADLGISARQLPHLHHRLGRRRAGAARSAAKFVQEVTAVSLAVEKLHPEVHSVIELGGQDAKIIVFKDDPESGRKKKIPSMNDKCAGGTGAVIDKINAKLQDSRRRALRPGLSRDQAAQSGRQVRRVRRDRHQWPAEGGHAIRRADGVAVRGHRAAEPHGAHPRPHAAPARAAARRAEHVHPRNAGSWQAEHPEDVARARRGASGRANRRRAHQSTRQRAVLCGARRDRVRQGRGRRRRALRRESRRCALHRLSAALEEKAAAGGQRSERRRQQELDAFKRQYTAEDVHAGDFRARVRPCEAFVGVDGGSTSTKAVLLSDEGDVLCKAYQLSKGNPIQDTIDMFDELRRSGRAAGRDARRARRRHDRLRERHPEGRACRPTPRWSKPSRTPSRRCKYYDDPHVIVDVGGQDIKLIVLKNGRVKDFKLNTQCSAGNGYFLQSTAEAFGMPVQRICRQGICGTGHADFGYGCAVFMQSDIVELPAAGMGAPKRSWPDLRRCCPRTSSCTSRAFRIWRSSARASCCRAERSTTSRR